MEEVKVYSERIAANLGCFHDEDRGSILCWLERLNRCPKDEEEAGRLAEYARYLNHVIANGRIHYPFTDPPPCRKLPPLQEYFRKYQESCGGAPEEAETAFGQRGGCQAFGTPERWNPESQHNASPGRCRPGFLDANSESPPGVIQSWVPDTPPPYQLARSPPASCPGELQYLRRHSHSPQTPRSTQSPCPLRARSPRPSPAQPPCRPNKPEFSDDDGKEKFAGLENVSVGTLLQEYDRIEDAAKRDALLNIINDMLEFEDLGRPQAQSTPVSKAKRRMIPEQGPCPPTVDDLQNMSARELMHVFKRELSAEPNPYVSLRLHFMAKTLSELLTQLEGEEVKVWPFHHNPTSFQRRYPHIRNMTVEELFGELKRGEKDTSGRHKTVFNVLMRLFCGHLMPGRNLSWQTDLMGLHLSVDEEVAPFRQPQKIPFMGILDLNFFELREVYVKELKEAKDPRSSVRVQVMSALLTKFLRLRQRPRYPHLQDLTVGQLLEEFEIGEHEKSSRHEAVVQMLKDVFWKGDQPDPARNPKGYTLAREGKGRPTLDDILNMNLQELDEQLDYEFHFEEQPYKSVRIMMMQHLYQKGLRLQYLADKTGQPIDECAAGQDF